MNLFSCPSSRVGIYGNPRHLHQSCGRESTPRSPPGLQEAVCPRGVLNLAREGGISPVIILFRSADEFPQEVDDGSDIRGMGDFWVTSLALVGQVNTAAGTAGHWGGLREGKDRVWPGTDGRFSPLPAKSWDQRRKVVLSCWACRRYRSASA